MSINNNESINELPIEVNASHTDEESIEPSLLECNEEVVNFTNEQTEIVKEPIKVNNLEVDSVKLEEVAIKENIIIDDSKSDKDNHESLKQSTTHNKHEHSHESSHKLQEQINKLASNFESLKDNFASITPVLQGITPALIDITSVIKEMKSTMKDYSKEMTEVVDENMEQHNQALKRLEQENAKVKAELTEFKKEFQDYKEKNTDESVDRSIYWCEKVILGIAGPMLALAPRTSKMEIIKDNQFEFGSIGIIFSFVLSNSGICNVAPTVIDYAKDAISKTKSFSLETASFLHDELFLMGNENFIEEL
jgi:chromosome segregation ATPase